MKITQTNAQYVEEMMKRKYFDLQNNKCPCCGKREYGFTFIRETGGFLGMFTKEEYFKTYRCHRCGTEWESDPWTE